MRLLFAILALAVVFIAADTGPGPSAAEKSVQVADAVMQCMEKCIRNEGKTEKDTCKMRCAKIGTGGGKKRDCGQEYRACIKSCNKDKVCKKACKATLMNCV